MEKKFMYKQPEIIVFAGPNGSGKTTISEMVNIIEPYINADNIKRSNHCTDQEAAEFADLLRSRYIVHIYDNTIQPFRIFKKRKSETFIWENEFWSESDIRELVQIR
ncbi:MAG: hypothetical protein JJE17_12220 [Peptostreptococcaceae bacterium]|nr:hypothetical protein [Peptostreptococcaceae bacterium]